MILLIIATLTQSILGLHTQFNGIHPNLVLVLVLAWSLLFPWPETAIWVFVAGFILDIFSGLAFGLSTVSLLAVSLLATLWRTNDGVNSILAILLALPYTLVFNIIILSLLMIITGKSVAWVSMITQFFFLEGVLNVIAMLFIYPWIIWLTKIERSDVLKL
ncbi:MAG: rod shape-determining protein MreD [Chloroflexota bacterium]